MSFMDAVKNVFFNYATFSGRARRTEYWYFTLFNVIVAAVLNTLAQIVPALAFLSGAYSLAILIPSLAVIWRRFHDIGKGGAWYFIILVPLVGWIIVLVWLCKDSQPGANQFGPSPKYPDAEPAAAAASAAPAAPSVSAAEEDEFAKAMKAFKDSSK